MTLVFCLGSFLTAMHLKKPWCSTHFFQKFLHSLRPSKKNSTTSLNAPPCNGQHMSGIMGPGNAPPCNGQHMSGITGPGNAPPCNGQHMSGTTGPGNAPACNGQHMSCITGPGNAPACNGQHMSGTTRVENKMLRKKY